MPSFLTHLECSRCGRVYDARRLQNTCGDDGRPLLARYDLAAVRRALPRAALARREASLWRYRELLPIADDAQIATLGEGWSPLLPCPRLGAALGLERLLVKDEGQLPTGSFKARGMAVAISRARELGARVLAAPSAGNAGAALAIYAARAGLPAVVVMPEDAPHAPRAQCVMAGARTYLFPGLITDCGRLIREGAAAGRWFDLSTLREPYRVEGKKTLGLELAEQLGWRLPDVVIYPTGGGTGLVGMAKAWEEAEALGWIGPARPRVVAVQAEGCAPIVRAFRAGAEFAAPWDEARTGAAGLRVPAAIGDFLMLRVLRTSGGTAVSVSEAEIAAAMAEFAATEGIFASPEGAATLAAARRLRAEGWLRGDEEVVLFNTGSGLTLLESVPVEIPTVASVDEIPPI